MRQPCSGMWGLQSVAKNAKRAGDLIGYLLRKKRQLANYTERHAHGDWIANTRGGNVVWPEYRRRNDIAV